jgi:hypothetical protein
MGFLLEPGSLGLFVREDSLTDLENWAFQQLEAESLDAEGLGFRRESFRLDRLVAEVSRTATANRRLRAGHRDPWDPWDPWDQALRACWVLFHTRGARVEYLRGDFKEFRDCLANARLVADPNIDPAELHLRGARRTVGIAPKTNTKRSSKAEERAKPIREKALEVRRDFPKMSWNAIARFVSRLSGVPFGTVRRQIADLRVDLPPR